MSGALRKLLRYLCTRLRLRARFDHVVDEVLDRHLVPQKEALDDVRRELADQRARLAHIAQDVGGIRERTGEEVRAAMETCIDHLRGFEVRSRRDLIFAGEAEAARTSAAFARRHLAGARKLGQPRATLEHALAIAPEGGMALEFGVHSGGTLGVIARARGGQLVYGFDSFEGLPEHWRPGFPAGTFALGDLPDVPGAEIVPGWFAEVLPGFLAVHPGPVDVVHLDADLYSSTAAVLHQVGPRLRPGSVIVFDEFFNYPGWQDHEHRAWVEWVERERIGFRYEAFTYDNEQVVVVITSGAPAPTS